MDRFELAEPRDYFKGVGQSRLPTPTDILLFTRTTKEKLQQQALQNRSHHRFVLSFNLETAGHVHIDNRVHPFSPGQALLILPFQFHHFSQLSSPRLHWLFCTFELHDEGFLEPLRNRVLDIGPPAERLRDTLVEDWKRCSGGPALLDGEQLQATLLRLLLALKQAGRRTDPATPAAEPRDNLVRTVNRLLYEWRGRPVSVADLADRIGLSESRLRTLFREAAGIPLGHYIRNYRINRAMGLLRTTTLPIGEIAEEAGFASSQAFSRTIKAATGLSPRAYRVR